METTRTKKMSAVLSLFAVLAMASAWLMPDTLYRAAMDNDLTRALRKKMEEYSAHLPEDRLYIQTDKPFYEPGDDIWLSAYIRDGASLKPSTKSDIVCVELLNPKGSVEKKISIIARNGKAKGDFTIDKEAPGGIYKIRAYTNWMKNEGEDNSFVKEIQVQEVILPNLKMKLDFRKKAYGPGDEVIARLELNTNENMPLAKHAIRYAASLNGEKLTEQGGVTDETGETFIRFRLPQKLSSNDGLLNVMIDYNGSVESISRSIPILMNTVKFTMYPEGGDLVAGFEGMVAFRALNEFGKPADVEGAVLTEKGSRVATFSSFHQGMGAFKLTPQRGEKYFVKITRPEGISVDFPIPAALQRGYALQADNSKQGEIKLSVASTEAEELALVAQVRGKMYYSTVITASPGTQDITFSTEKFPIGVAQITLFDSKGIARAERLAFVNRDKQMSVSVETEKEKYLPREKVRMTVSVKDERGLPMPANLSMAVVNDQLLSFADDRSGNILSQMLLQQDLKETIEEPAFYFNKAEQRSLKALDYVMMTSGWRRFTWEKLMEEELPPVQFPGKKAIVAGIIYDGNTQKPMANVKINNGSTQYTADASGKFALSRIDLSSLQTLGFTADGYYPQQHAISDYNQDLVFYMYKADKRPVYLNSAAMTEQLNMAPDMAAAPAGIELEAAPVLERKKTLMKQPQRARKEREEKAVKQLPEDVMQNEKEGARLEKAAPVQFREDRFIDRDEVMARPQMPVQVLYYRARQYYAPDYEKQQATEARSDFRNTIYWNPDLEIGHSGRKTIEFYASDDITSFRVSVEGMSGDGMVGRTEKRFYTQLPFAMSVKVPVEVATEDILSLPVTLKNNTQAPLGGLITISVPAGLQELSKPQLVQTIMPGKAKTIYLDYKVLDKTGEGDLSIGFKSCGLSDAFNQKIRIVPKGFPAQVSFSSQEAEKEYSFEIRNLVNGSLKASLTAFPNVVSDLMKGVEGILQEPYGCFEQTSCTAYPNAMVLDYLKNTDSKDMRTLARATDLLDRGYKRLTSFEASGKGYEWFGANPAHEGLTAYGIMEFVDMKKAGQEIDQKMLDRTAQWLLNHRDGKGGFTREQHALHDFGRISDDILNAYIVYALAEAGYEDIKKEFESSFAKAVSSKDPYMLAMMSNAAFSMGQAAKGKEALTLLLAAQAQNGSFNGTTHSITYSQGSSLVIETTALSILAMLKAPSKDVKAINAATQYLTSVRSGSGVFSSTQGTILALKALTEYAKFSKRTVEDGTIVVYIDNKKVAERSYKAGDSGEINLDGLEQYIKGEGEHRLKVKYLGVKEPLPYSVALNWNTFLPQSNKECSIDLSVKLAAKTAHVGETIRLTAVLSNRKNEAVPNTMVIIGIPAGFSAQPWQLKEMQEKKVFDYYEIKGNAIALYYRGMGPAAVKTIQFDLKAEMPGTYDAPASSAYLYYMNEFKTWCTADKVLIKKAEEVNSAAE